MRLSIIPKIFISSILIVFASEIAVAQQATVKVNQDSQIPRLLKLKKSLEKDNKLSDGYTIQLYYGELNKANSVIKKYRNLYAAWPASIEYETPNYKVWVGNYSTRLEADRALIEIQREFSSAFILKPERKKSK
ncbi:MAG: SPOR domain-containing protein [Bacteroidia bacterium]|nr:SPOR domain-containing protein [Bacteroidia bacterium]NNF30533.1 SPOR domain-containing protein [Flavobacteriaceae bacterium]MBT8277133.1 SPOR domain-containing protein [Bacteroidia bacterium]NNJ81047.1 SPOR domain-containing protein [Flavobacteriaceae bacterium]NNK53880.1 SPOR domain-containing protein [Flavobacteriaceae bacterium]